MIIKLIRHGESKANSGEVDSNTYPDHLVPLSNKGIEQAKSAGRAIGKTFLVKALLYTSPYLRTRQTMACIIDGAEVCHDWDGDGPRIYQDPRLREVEWGYHKTPDQIIFEKSIRKTHGKFYYRFAGGESAADCYDRISTFIESLMRQVARKRNARCVIVTHGLTIRSFVMRWFHLTVDQFESIETPENCDIITITSREKLENPQFVSSKWGVTGLRFV